MAAKNRDLELRAKFKDDASKGAKRVADALKLIGEDAKKSAESVNKSNSAFNSLAADLGKLKEQSNKLSAFGTIAKELETATQSVKRMETGVRGSAEELAKLARQSDEAARAAARMRGEMAAEEAALQSNLAARKQQQEALKAQRAEVSKLEQELKDLNRLTKNGTTGNTGALMRRDTVQSQALPEAIARQARLDEDVKAYTAAIKENRAAIKTLRPEVNGLAQTEARLKGEVDKSAASLRKQKENLSGARSELSLIDQAASEGSAALGGLAANQREVEQASARMSQRIKENQRLLESYNKFATGSGDFADPKTAATLQRQNQAIREARDDWKALESEVARVSAEMRASGSASEAQVAAFNRLVGASRAAKTEYQRQTEELHRLRQVQKSTFAEFQSRVNPLPTNAQAAAAAQNQLASATQSATAAQQRLAPAAQRTAQSLQQGRTSADSFTGALLGIGRDTRQTLSFMQRLRGEVLALTTAYIGFYGAIQQVTGAVNAFRDLEAVQSRLGAVFEQDTGRIAQEITFLRAQADRLGISFSTLGNTYAKFAVAANAANFSQKATRDIFLAVAEAGRVNKLSIDQMNGVFLATEQIISKGKFTSEEVRRQLGDRLPGAFNILADAMGVTTAKLDEMMRKGELLATESNLMKFADQLTRRFGPQLSASLDTLSTDIGRFENNVFKARLAFTEGFIPGLRDALQAFDDFVNSAEGQEVFVTLGNVVGKFLNILGKVPEYFDEIVLAAQVFVGLKMAGVLLNISRAALTLRSSFVGVGQTMAFIGPQAQQMTLAQRTLGQSFAQVVGSIDRYRATLLTANATNGAARAGIMGLNATLGLLRAGMVATANVARGMWAAIGGIPGIIATGITFAVGAWITSVNDATSALSEHQRQLNAVQEAYEKTGGKAEDWAKTVKGVTVAEAEANLIKLTSKYEDKMDDLSDSAQRLRGIVSQIANPVFGEDVRRAQGDQFIDTIDNLDELVSSFEAGSIELDEFTNALDEIYTSTNNEVIKELIRDMLEVVQASEDGEPSMRDLAKAMDDQRKIIKALRGEQVDLGNAVEETNKTFDRTQFVSAYTDAIDKLTEAIPELSKEMERLQKLTNLTKVAWDGMLGAFQAGDYGKIIEIMGLLGRAQGAVNSEFISGATGSFVDKVVNTESGGNASAKNPNSSATGLGQFIESTWLRMFKEYFPDRAKGMTDAMILALREDAKTSRDMIELYAQENAKVLMQAGNAVNDMSLYLAHFLGPQGANKLLKAAPNTPVDQVLSSEQISANKSVLEGKNAGQVVAWAREKMNISETELSIIENINEAEQARIEKLREQQEATEKQLADTEFRIQQQKLVNAGKEREAAIEEALREARQENPNITAEQLDLVRNKTAKAYDLELEQQYTEELRKQQEKTGEQIADNDFKIQQQKLINAGKEREAAIEEALRKARQENPAITAEQLERIRQQTAQMYDLENATKQRELSEERVNQLYTLRQQLIEQLKIAQESGNFTMADNLKMRLSEVNDQIKEAIQNAIRMWEAIGGPEAEAAIAKLKTMGMSIENNSRRTVMFGLNMSQVQSLVGSFADGLTNAFDSFAQKIAKGENAIQALWTSFLQFAADFLRQIALMIIKQMILNALAGFGGNIGTAATALGGVAGHTGGIVGSAAIGSGNPIGRPTWMQHAFSYHSGGVAGLAPDEVSATLKKGEEILTEEDPRHRNNLGGANSQGGKDMRVKQVLAVGEDEIAKAMQGAPGEQVTLTHIKRNATTISRLLRGG